MKLYSGLALGLLLFQFFQTAFSLYIDPGYIRGINEEKVGTPEEVSKDPSTDQNPLPITIQKRAVVAPLLAQFSMKAILQKGKKGGMFIKENPKATASASLLLAGFAGYELLKKKLESHQTVDVYHHVVREKGVKPQSKRKRDLTGREISLTKRQAVAVEEEEDHHHFVKRGVNRDAAIFAISVGGLVGLNSFYSIRKSNDEHRESKVLRQLWELKVKEEEAKLAAMQAGSQRWSINYASRGKGLKGDDEKDLAGRVALSS